MTQACFYSTNCPYLLLCDHLRNTWCASRHAADPCVHVMCVIALAGSDGVKKLVSGGDPMFLNSPITLCGRVDLNADRFFDGQLVELSIFDSALTRPQVDLLSVDIIGCLLNITCQAIYLSNGPTWQRCRSMPCLVAMGQQMRAGGIPPLSGHQRPAECVSAR